MAAVVCAWLGARVVGSAIGHGDAWGVFFGCGGRGTEIRIADVRDAGARPALAVLAALVAASGVSLALPRLLF